MATDLKWRLQNRKRQHTEASLSQDDLSSLPPTESRPVSRFPPPSFWDNLSKVWLTRRALRELDRRNHLSNSTSARAPSPVPEPGPQNSGQRDIQHFARHGGPGLRDLRGYPKPIDTSLKLEMLSSQPSHPSASPGCEGTGKRSSAYDANFEQHLIDNGVFPLGYEYPDGRETPEPSDLNDIRRKLAVPRPSLSLSRFTDSDFRRYQQANLRVIDEGEVMRNVLPMLYGDSDISSKQDLQFTRLQSITNNATVTPKPDFYDGARLEEIDPRVRRDLAPFIMPTKHRTAPVAPNFFIEVKAPQGSVNVAKRQACYDGAIGARAMYKLQSYGEEPVFKNNAYTLSATYYAGTLRMYATHITPSSCGGSPEYHMNQLGGWDTTGDPDTYRRGAAALRNGRDQAKRWRDQSISVANERARSIGACITMDEYSAESQPSAGDFATSFADPPKMPSSDHPSVIREEQYEDGG